MLFQSTLNKTRENNKTNCAKTMVQALIYKFNELKQAHGRINRNSEDFHGIKELAKRFALSFGLDALKNREAVAGLHREGWVSTNWQEIWEFKFLFLGSSLP